MVFFVFWYTDKAFLQHLVELKAQVRLNTQLLQSQAKLLQDLLNIAGKQRGLEGAASTGPTMPSSVVLPMQSFQQVQRLERTLRATPVERQKLVCAVQ